MAIFLDAEQIYRVLQRELPEGVYPDGAPSGSYSAASLYSKATLFDQAYDNLRVIYDNFFPQTADEKQIDWEVKVFGNQLDGSLSLSERRQRVINKLRQKPGITVQDMIDVVKSIIGEDKDVAIGEWGCDTGSWIIGVSELAVTTILSGARLLSVTPLLYPGVEICEVDPLVTFGITEEEWQEMRTSAYTYSVLIYDYTLTDLERQEVDFQLGLAEPARSAHSIEDGLPASAHI